MGKKKTDKVSEEVLDLTEAEGLNFKRFQARPIPKLAARIDKPFEVKTLEGVMRGKAGDYLVVGINKERYICDADVFSKTYICIE